MLKINLKKITEELIPSFYEAGKESIKLSTTQPEITYGFVYCFKKGDV